MAILVDEKRMVENNIFEYEDKLKSPTSRFMDTTPTYVTYYHINADESTTDEGFKDVASILGHRSPLKFKKISNFPIYGMDQVVLNLQDADQGLDTEFSGDAIILPNTIKPLANDFFIIPYLHDAYIFRVTEIGYDTIMPDNFYKINYQLEYIDPEKEDLLEKQSNESYTCVLDNIGTENKCLIETETLSKVNKVAAMYDDIATTFMTLFYDEKHNCLLGDLGLGRTIYDPFMTEFVNRHALFNKKNDLKTVIFTEELEDKLHRLKYEKSVYKFIERQDYTRVSNFKFTYSQGSTFHETSFYRWADSRVQVLDIPSVFNDKMDIIDIFSDEFVTAIKTNGFTESKHAELILKYVRKAEIKIGDIPLDLNEELLDLNTSLEVFFITPIIMYILKQVMTDTINNA